MKEKKQVNPYKVGVISLGCDKNRVDTENMMTFLFEDGNFVFTADPSLADVIIINTCSFIKSARDESNETIDEMIKYREEGVAKCLVVTGCYPQKYLKELTQNYPQVDIFLGTNEYRNIVQILEEFLNDKHRNQIVKTDSAYSLDEVTKGRLITTPFYTAYLKIADGCDNFCSYCTIPYIRGRYRSREFNSLIEEAKDLVRSGVRELIIVAQDITKYGIDNYGEKRLPELLHELGKIKNLKWIRLLYCYPENITPELISEINSNKKICKYIDVPFQHISNDILKAMNRHIQTEEVEKIIQDIKNGIPGVSIRSTFILGFPGETKEHFNELVGFLKNNKLPNVGFFTYSREDGTVAARLAGQVDETTKKRRLLKAARVQKRVVVEFNKSLVGEPLEVLLEGFDEKKGLYFGRTQYQAPDIDTVVYFSSDKDVKIGEFYECVIVKAKGYDLYGVTI